MVFRIIGRLYRPRLFAPQDIEFLFFSRCDKLKKILSGRPNQNLELLHLI